MICKALAANGARRVYIVGRRQDILEEACQAIDPEVVVPLPGDVTSLEALLQTRSASDQTSAMLT